ncbi:hypothetical protein PENTCL1PPCAC_949, partial [Pristionchus entomophagus]
FYSLQHQPRLRCRVSLVVGGDLGRTCSTDFDCFKFGAGTTCDGGCCSLPEGTTCSPTAGCLPMMT